MQENSLKLKRKKNYKIANYIFFRLHTMDINKVKKKPLRKSYEGSVGRNKRIIKNVVGKIIKSIFFSWFLYTASTIIFNR